MAVATLVPPTDGGLWRLTEREREILALLADGHSNRGIARGLGVTTRTVETHLRRIFMKLDLEETDRYHRRVQAALVHLRASGECSGGHAWLPATAPAWS